MVIIKYSGRALKTEHIPFLYVYQSLTTIDRWINTERVVWGSKKVKETGINPQIPSACGPDGRSMQCAEYLRYSLKRSLSLLNFVTVSWEAFYAACHRNPAWQETQMCLSALFLWLQLDVDSCFMMYASLWFYFHSTVGRLFTACMFKWMRGLVVGNEPSSRVGVDYFPSLFRTLLQVEYETYAAR